MAEKKFLNDWVRIADARLEKSPICRDEVKDYQVCFAKNVELTIENQILKTIKDLKEKDLRLRLEDILTFVMDSPLNDVSRSFCQIFVLFSFFS